MKKGLTILGLVVCVVVLSFAQAHADNFTAAMVSNSTSETPLPLPVKYWDTETPWLFLETSTPAFQHSYYTTWAWLNATKWDVMGHVDLASSNDTKNWFTLLPDWSGMPTGQWKVAALMSDESPGADFCCNGKCIYFERATPPVPEPISTTLFLLGGGALGLKLYRRKKA